MADLLMITGDLQGAQKMAEEGLAIRKDLGESINIASSQQQMGAIALHENRLPEAEAFLRDALNTSRKPIYPTTSSPPKHYW